MNVDVIHSEDRGVTENEWLYSMHTYSFGRYYDLKRLNFGALRVFNDDVVQPGKGFGTHSHDNMEIVTIVLDGALEHKDSMGTHGILKAGDVQRMSAGKGIQHSEWNGSKEEKVHFLQIWVYPKTRDLAPSYEQKQFDVEKSRNQFVPIVTPIPSEEALSIHQDAQFLMGAFDKGQKVAHQLKSNAHGVYLFVIEGAIQCGDASLKKGDSAQITNLQKVEIESLEPSKLLLIEIDVNTL